MEMGSWLGLGNANGDEVLRRKIVEAMERRVRWTDTVVTQW